MDTVLLDPPLVALDKDAPVPYAGRKNRYTLTQGNISCKICANSGIHTHLEIKKDKTHILYTHPPTHTLSHTHRGRDKDASVLCAGNCGNLTPQDKNR